MSDDHGAQQPDLGGEAGGAESREPSQNVGTEEDGTQHGRLDPEAAVEPVGDKRLHDKATGEGIDREERRQAQNLPA